MFCHNLNMLLLLHYRVKHPCSKNHHAQDLSVSSLQYNIQPFKAVVEKSCQAMLPLSKSLTNIFNVVVLKILQN